MNQFVRTSLIIGEENIEKLKNKHVAIFGIGGVGSFSAEAIARAGIGKITLIDNDKVALSNLNRQLVALHSTLDKYKTEVMAERIADINPEAKVFCRNIFFDGESAKEIDFNEFDFVIDAIDSVSSKVFLIEKCSETNTPIISAMGAGNKLDPTKFEVSDIYKTSVCPLAKVMRNRLKKSGIKKLKVVYSKEIPAEKKGEEKAPGSISFVPSVMGLILAGEVIKDLIK